MKLLGRLSPCKGAPASNQQLFKWCVSARTYIFFALGKLLFHLCPEGESRYRNLIFYENLIIFRISNTATTKTIWLVGVSNFPRWTGKMVPVEACLALILLLKSSVSFPRNIFLSREGSQPLVSEHKWEIQRQNSVSVPRCSCSWRLIK